VAVAALVVLTISVATLVSGAQAAHADDAPTMQFSSDGVTWSTVYSGQLFGNVRVIPGGSATRDLWVKNDAPEAGQLRVTVANVTTNSTALADGMTLSSTASTVAPAAPSTQPGVAIALSAAQPCATLSQGLIVDANGAADITTTMALADINGLAAQAGWVSFVLRITFSSLDQGAPAPDTCPTDPGTATVSGVTEPTVSSGQSSAVVYRRVSSGWKSTASAAQEPAVSTPVEATPLPAPIAQLPAPFRALAANTYRFYQEWDVALWLAMMTLGALTLVIIRHRRHRREDAEYYALLDLASYPISSDSSHPDSQIGPSR
jgi:hypothetical protein